MGSMQRIQAIIHGQVQGVGFRYHTRQTAQRLELVGYVRNRADGTVELGAEGPQAAIDALLDWAHQGPPAAVVTQVEITFQPLQNTETQFSITA